MNTTTCTDTARRELATRLSDGVEITLFWDARDDSTSIDLYDTATARTTSFHVAPDRALDAFHHPFAQLGRLEHHVPQADIDIPWTN
jgi:hypothetical protein